MTNRPGDFGPGGLPVHASGPGSTVPADMDSTSVDIDPEQLARQAEGGTQHPSSVPPPDPKTDGSSRLGVLRHKHFRTVWSAAFVSNIGNWMELVGVQILVATQTKDIKMSAYLGMAATLPILLFGLIGGLVADRTDRRRLLMITQFLMMAVAAGVLAVSLMSWAPGSEYTRAWILIALTALNGVVMAFNMPAWQVLTPRLVPREELTRAITLLGIQFNMSRVVGPLLAGALMAFSTLPFGLTGLNLLFIINTCSFMIVAAAVWTTPPSPVASADFSNPVGQITAALKFMVGSRGPLAVFLAVVTVSALAAPLIRLLTQFAIDVYHHANDDAENTTTRLIAILGVGAVAGGVLVRRIPPWYPKHHFIPASIAGLGLFITLFGLLRSETWASLVMLPIGLFWIWSFNQTWAAMQNLVPDEMRGRVMSVAGVASFGATGVGVMLSGLVGDRLKDITLLGYHLTATEATQAAVLSLSITLLAAGIVMLLFRTPEVDGLPRLPPGSRRSRSLINAILATEHRPGAQRSPRAMDASPDQ